MALQSGSRRQRLPVEVCRVGGLPIQRTVRATVNVEIEVNAELLVPE
jgi:hypothetical protein